MSQQRNKNLLHGGNYREAWDCEIFCCFFFFSKTQLREIFYMINDKVHEISQNILDVQFFFPFFNKTHIYVKLLLNLKQRVNETLFGVLMWHEIDGACFSRKLFNQSFFRQSWNNFFKYFQGFTHFEKFVFLIPNVFLFIHICLIYIKIIARTW